VYNSYYYYNTDVLTPPVHNEISIHITFIFSVSCVQRSVNQGYNSLSQQLVGSSDNSRLVCCVYSRLSGKQH